MMDILAMAKLAGISESELKGQSVKDQIKLITKAMTENVAKVEVEEAKVYISNCQKQLPKLKENLSQTFEIYVKAVGQKKSPTVVPVVGYNATTKEVIVFYNEKLYPIKEANLITTIDDFAALINAEKSKNAKKKDEKKK